MQIIINTESTKELAKELISEAYEKIDFELDYVYKRADRLIALAISNGLNDEAEEMEKNKTSK